MKSFLVMLGDKQPSRLHKDLLLSHVEYLQQLRERGLLPLCGPFTDNNGAVLIIRAPSKEEAKLIMKRDPFLIEGYYQNFLIHEFREANEENNWLIDSEETSEK